jgi:hypothetical protein
MGSTSFREQVEQRLAAYAEYRSAALARNKKRDDDDDDDDKDALLSDKAATKEESGELPKPSFGAKAAFLAVDAGRFACRALLIMVLGYIVANALLNTTR